MTRVLVLYYSSYGHVEAMTNAEAERARLRGANVVVKRVPRAGADRDPPGHRVSSSIKLLQFAQGRRAARLRRHHLRITPPALAASPAKCAAFLDQAGGLWARGKARRQSRLGVYLDRHPTTAARKSTILTFIPTLIALRHVGRGAAL